MTTTVLKIKASVGYKVGKNGKNRAVNNVKDVIVVEKLLNIAREKHPKLKEVLPQKYPEDGIDSDLVGEGIYRFQYYAMNWTLSGCDGIVDVNGKTWKALNGNTPVLAQVRSVTSAETLRTFAAFRQGDYKVKLGHGSQTISAWGCTMCCLTMAATAIGARTLYWKDPLLQPKDLDPTKVNQILKEPGTDAFQGSRLAIGNAAKALGMEYEGTHVSGQASLGQINSHLACGYPVMLHVDYKSKVKTEEVDNPAFDATKPVDPKKNPKKITKDVKDSDGNLVYTNTYEGDHWILLISRSGDTYTCLDPSYGATVLMTSDVTAQVIHNARAGVSGSYGVPILCGKHGFSGRSPDDYTVRRFGLLAPLPG